MPNPDLLFLVPGGLTLGGFIGGVIAALIGDGELRDNG